MLVWHDIASHLRCTVAEAKQRIYAREFIRWKAYLERQWNEHTKLDYYLAQIALEIRRMRPKPEKAKLAHYLLRFKTRGSAPEKTEEPQDENQPTEKPPSIMKSFFLGVFGKPTKVSKREE